MSDQGKANYDGYYAAMPGADPVPFEELPHAERLRWDGGAYAVERWLSELPVDEDAPGNEPAKVIIVTAPGDGCARRYRSDGWTITDGTLLVNLNGHTVAVYPSGIWTSFREDGSEVPDATAKALDIAMGALAAVVDASNDYDAPFGRPEIGDIVGRALADIAELSQ